MNGKESKRSASGSTSVEHVSRARIHVERAMAIRLGALCGDINLREVCEANGLSEDAFVREGHLVPSLDLFMSGVNDARCLSHFRGLNALCFINVPNLASLSVLETCCPGLESLIVTECGLNSTEGLGGLTNLNNLQLSSNDLQSLHGLRGMTSLRKLWANDNRIKSMDGLSSLASLEELWLCRNRFTEIDNGLPLGPNLREVNLAHNRLGCFKELLKLAPFEGLRSLTLQDPHFGDNPVCGLSNYKTYVAYHLTQLTSLDMGVVSREAKAFANTVFLKKSMYYNMRSRIVKRHAGHVIRKATELCGEKAAKLQTTLIHLQWQSKHVEQRLMADRMIRELSSEPTSDMTPTVVTRYNGEEGDLKGSLSMPGASVATADSAAILTPSVSIARQGKALWGTDDTNRSETGKRNMSASETLRPEKFGELNTPSGLGRDTGVGNRLEVLQLRAKGQALTRAVVVVEGVLHKMEEQLGVFKRVVGGACKRAVSELMLEFDTGGNVRFEEGRPGDVWFSSCADLVRSRVVSSWRQNPFSSKKEAAPGLKISRVIRIHNRYLKNRFERCAREATIDVIGEYQRGARRSSSDISTSAAISAPSFTPASVHETTVAVIVADKATSGADEERVPFARRSLNYSGDHPQQDDARATTPVVDLAGGTLDVIEHGRTPLKSRVSSASDVWGSLSHEGASRKPVSFNSGGDDASAVAVEDTRPEHRGAEVVDIPNEDTIGVVSPRTAKRVNYDGRRDCSNGVGCINAGVCKDEGSENSIASTKISTAYMEKLEARGEKRHHPAWSTSSSRTRNFEYLFFTGRRGGAGCGNNGGGDGKGGRRAADAAGAYGKRHCGKVSESNYEGNGGNRKQRSGAGSGTYPQRQCHQQQQQHPDLLKLAEDGFRLFDWDDTKVAKDVLPDVAFDATPATPAKLGAIHTSQASDLPYTRPNALVLSTHLNRTDIPGMYGGGAAMFAQTTAADSAAETGTNSIAAEARPASVEAEPCQETDSPVCRVLVVKVFTGSSRRVPFVSSQKNGADRGDFGLQSPYPSTFREAWEEGLKSLYVCAGEDLQSGYEGGDGDGDIRYDAGLRNKNAIGARSNGAPYLFQEWYVLDGALALPEYIIEFDISPEMGEAAQAIKDGVRQRVNKWRHELAPFSRPSHVVSSPSLPTATTAITTPLTTGIGKNGACGRGRGSGGGGSSGRAAGGTDALPFLIPLARLARQLEIDTASYASKYEVLISKALQMEPSAPALGFPPISRRGPVHTAGLRDGVAIGNERAKAATDSPPAVTIAAGSSHLLTRLSLHGQGVQNIKGLESCQNLRVLILSFNEISRLDGLAGLEHLEHLDLGYNIIEEVERYYGDTSQEVLHDTSCPAVSAVTVIGNGFTASEATAITSNTSSTSNACYASVSLMPDRANPYSTQKKEPEKADNTMDGGQDEIALRSCAEVANGVVYFPSLTRLDLNNNILHDLDDLKALWRLAPSLTVLDIRGNPLRTARTYRGAAIRGIPGLEVLDGRSVTQKEISLHNECRSLTLDMLRRNGRRQAPRLARHRTACDIRNNSGAEGAAHAEDGSCSRHVVDRNRMEVHGGQLESSRRLESSSSSSGLSDSTCSSSRGGDNSSSNNSSVRTGSGSDSCTEAPQDDEQERQRQERHGSNGRGDAGEGYDSRTSLLGGEEVGSNDGTSIHEKTFTETTAVTVASALLPGDRGSSVGSSSCSESSGGSGQMTSAPSTPRNANLAVAAGTRYTHNGAGDLFRNTPTTPAASGLVLEDIELVGLQNLSLRKLEGMERLTRLKVADLSGNELHDTAPLRLCVCLEELNLEGNELTTTGLRGLHGLLRLTKLDVGYNQISDLQPVCELTGLSQLSVESNLLHNLRGLSKLRNLMELYCGNNNVAAKSEIERLKELPRLIILDTSGNPCCSSPHFRHLVLFKISNLKVLDGIGVGGTEIAEAKLKFAGKLTEEALWKRYNADKVEALKYLDLSKSKWRGVEILPSLPFRSLQELNLDKNLLANFVALGGLPSLGVLRLSYNRIETIGQVDSEESDGSSGPDEGCVFPRLEVLYLGFNRISDIRALGLERMPLLLAVDLQGNNIGSIGGLNRCRTLVEVNLDGNKIRQLGPHSALNGLSNLRKLRLEDNGLRALAAGLAASTPALLSLSLAQNRIADPAELDRLGALPNLIELTVNGNPMARRPYSRLALLALFPSLAAVDSSDITAEEKRLAESLSGGSSGMSVPIAPYNVVPAETWGLVVPGLGAATGGSGSGSGSCSGNSPGSGNGGENGVVGGAGSVGRGAGGTGVVSPVGASSARREYFTVGSVGGIVCKPQATTVLHQGGSNGWNVGASTSHAFSPFRPHDSLPPPNGLPAGNMRGTTSSGDREARASAADDSLVQKIARNIKGGPASPGTSSVVFDSAGDTLAAGGGHRRSSLQLPGNVKWAPLSTGRRMGVGGGIKRPLKLTSMNFSSTIAGEDERSSTASRGGSRYSTLGHGTGTSGNSGSGRTGAVGGNSRQVKAGSAPVAIEAGARVTPALSYGQVVSLPAGVGALGRVRGRHER